MSTRLRFSIMGIEIINKKYGRPVKPVWKTHRNRLRASNRPGGTKTWWPLGTFPPRFLTENWAPALK